MTASNNHDVFMRLFAVSHRDVSRYIFALMPNETDADEVFQQVCVVLWEKFDSYKTDSSFKHWAFSIALNVIRNYRRKLGRDRLIFSDQILSALAEDQMELEEVSSPRKEALTHCLETLREQDRELVLRCYGGLESFKEVAGILNRSVNTVYKALNRIRGALLKCINDRTGGNSSDE